MAAKYLHSLADENPDLQKQIGCMNGVFQIFNRQNMVGFCLLFNNQTYGAPIMEKHRVSTESSNDSFYSWSPSSPFSYVNNQNVDLRDVVKDSMYREARGLSHKKKMKKESNSLYYDEPRELLRSKSCQFNDSFPFSLSKDYPRFSYDGRETDRLFSKTDSKTKVKELPRLSVDSKERAIRTLNSVSLVPIKQSDSKSNISRNPEINGGAYAEKDMSQTQTQTQPPSVVAKLMGLETFPVSKSLKSSDDCGPGSTRNLLSPCQKNPDMKPISRVPVEAAPWKQWVVTASTKIHTSGSSVYNDVDKRLENLEFAQSGKDLRALKQVLEAMKAVEARKVERFDAEEGISDDNLEISKDFKAHESHIVIMKPAKLVVKGFTNNIDSCKPRKQSHKQHSECKSSSGRKKPSNFKKIDDQNKETQSLQQVNGGRVSDFSTPEKSRVLVKVGEQLTQEYPSPVSVLDSVYTENSPSPVKWTPIIQKDDATPKSAEKSVKDQCKATNKIQSNTINREKLKKVEDLIQKLKRFNSDHNESHTDYIASLCENTNPNDRYISEILLASGILLEDLESSEFHTSGHPINPDLFFVLEHIKFSNLQKGKYHRKLIFDAVNEILERKLVSGSKMMQNSRKLLKEMCFEIEKLQVQKKKEDDNDDLKIILWENLLKISENWESFSDERLVIAVEVELLIFRDLVNEVVVSEACCL